MKNKKIFIVVIGVLILIEILIGSVVYNKYSINLNLSFNLNTKVSWNNISKRYQNIINMYDTKEKETNLINEALNNNLNSYKILNNLKINPDVYARQLNIQYRCNNENEGFEVINKIGNEIIRKNESFMPKENVKIEKSFSVNTENIKIDKRLNILIFAIWGLALGIGLSIIMEARWLSRKK